jgi:hypothetical protein
MPGNWHVRFGGGPYGKGPANFGHLAVRPTQPFQFQETVQIPPGSVSADST